MAMMFRNMTAMASGAWPLMTGLGLMSITFGLLVIAFPTLLIYLVGSLFLFVGLVFLSMGLQMRRQQRTAPTGDVFEEFRRQVYRGE